MIEWRKWGVVAALAAGAAICLTMAVMMTLQGWQSSSAEARLGKGQASAAIASGQDAVNSIGAAEAGASRIDQISRENDHEIRTAHGANVPVDGAVHDAGLASLCRRASYSGNPKCMQFTPAGGVAQGRTGNGTAGQ